MKKFLFLASFWALEIFGITPDEALKKLEDGNLRFMSEKMENCHFSGSRREALKEGQTPFAIVVGCSDSRVPSEIVFDQGLGDLFGVRTAGNVIGPIEVNSIDYGVLVLKAPLIVVMGHESCGAIKAVLGGNTKGVEAVAKLITEATQDKELTMEAATLANIRYGVETLKNSKDLAPLIKEGKLRVIGAYYHFKDGNVQFLK